MKKSLLIFISCLLGLSLTACGSDSSEVSKKDHQLVVAATSVPHAAILEQAKPILKEEGIDLEIKVYDDYILPNTVLDDGSVDANYFQTIPYMEQQMDERGYQFVNAGGIHIEPIGVYSKAYKSLDELPDGATILMSNSVSDHGRILSLFEQEGLITLKEGVEKSAAQISDIASNPKHLDFKADYQAQLLPQLYNNDEGDAVVINSNFALSSGLNPMKDAIAIEDKDSPYVNVIAVPKGDEDNEDIQKLIEVLHSKEIQDWIISEYDGAVVPVSE